MIGTEQYFEERTKTDVQSHIDEILQRKGITIDDVANEMCFDNLAGLIEDGNISLKSLSAVLHHLGYKMLFTVRSINSSDREQAENWSRS